jgi:hypothetical protein
VGRTWRGRHRRGRAGLAAAALRAAAGAVVASQALAAKDNVILIARATGPAGAPVDANAISANGDQVGFDTFADNLSAEDDNAVMNVFARDAAANATILVSRATGAAGAGGNGDSGGASISGDGRVVAFVSDADNLSADGRYVAFGSGADNLCPMTTTASGTSSCGTSPPRRSRWSAGRPAPAARPATTRPTAPASPPQAAS